MVALTYVLRHSSSFHDWWFTKYVEDNLILLFVKEVYTYEEQKVLDYFSGKYIVTYVLNWKKMF